MGSGCPMNTEFIISERKKKINARIKKNPPPPSVATEPSGENMSNSIKDPDGHLAIGHLGKYTGFIGTSLKLASILL